MNLFQKIIEVRKSVEELSKDTDGFGYRYVSGNQILKKVTEKMNEHNLILMPTASSGETKPLTYVNAAGESKIDILVSGDMAYIWIDAESEEKYVVPWAYYGQQNDASKAFGSGLTYSERYFWLKLLGLPTDEDDPDGQDTRGRQAPRTVTTNTGRATSASAERIFSTERKITVPQQKRLIAKAKGDMALVSSMLLEYEISKVEDVPMGATYDAICRAIDQHQTEGGNDE